MTRARRLALLFGASLLAGASLAVALDGGASNLTESVGNVAQASSAPALATTPTPQAQPAPRAEAVAWPTLAPTPPSRRPASSATIVPPAAEPEQVVSITLGPAQCVVAGRPVPCSQPSPVADWNPPLVVCPKPLDGTNGEWYSSPGPPGSGPVCEPEHVYGFVPPPGWKFGDPVPPWEPAP